MTLYLVIVDGSVSIILNKTIVCGYYDLILPAIKVIKKLITFNGTSNTFLSMCIKFLMKLGFLLPGFNEEYIFYYIYYYK